MHEPQFQTCTNGYTRSKLRHILQHILRLAYHLPRQTTPMNEHTFDALMDLSLPNENIACDEPLMYSLIL